MSKVAAFVFLILLAAGCSRKNSPAETVDDSGVRDSLESQAVEFLEAIETGLFAHQADFMHPAFIEISGGKEQYMKRITASWEGRGENQVDTYQLIEISQIVKEGAALAAFVNVEKRMTHRDKPFYYLSKYYYIASSADNGVTWLFMPGGDNDPDGFYDLHFPVLRREVPIPETSMKYIKEGQQHDVSLQESKQD